jgi:hypothetical protein
VRFWCGAVLRADGACRSSELRLPNKAIALKVTPVTVAGFRNCHDSTQPSGLKEHAHEDE